LVSVADLRLVDEAQTILPALALAITAAFSAGDLYAILEVLEGGGALSSSESPSGGLSPLLTALLRKDI